MPDDPFKMGMGGGDDAPPAGDDAAPAAEEAPAADQAEKNVVTLSADHFPPDIKPKDGDKLTFTVTGEPDEQGNVSGYFEATGGDGKPGTKAWESNFKKFMSPTASAEESQ